MRIGSIGHTGLSGIARASLAGLALAATLALGACTTVEGTNALTDFGTFEREVMSSTARGIGLIPGEEPKADLTNARAPLVLPKSTEALPAPVATATAAQLPTNSNSVQIDTSNISEADLQRLRNARVVDLRTLSGRPLTDAEARQLTARMQQANITVTGNANRPLYLPPSEYFVRVGDADLVCRTPAGELVSLRDDRCPAEIRRALARSGPASSAQSGTQGARLTESETKL